MIVVAQWKIDNGQNVIITAHPVQSTEPYELRVLLRKKFFYNLGTDMSLKISTVRMFYIENTKR